jgi:hypothetical protein
MTPEELKTMKECVAAADTAQRRVDEVTEAMRQITDAKVREISLRMIDGPEPIIGYRTVAHDNFEPVCWARDYPSLAHEIRDAVIRILDAKLKTAEELLAKI